VNFSKKLLELLRPSTRVCVLTGAGVSQESGVATFRDPGGLWQKFRPEELANMSAFLANPTLVWEWYEYRRQVIRSVAPNAGHVALVAMQEFFGAFTLITQNVDGLHARAGSRGVLEVHGNINRSFCVDCSKHASAEFLESLKPGVPAECKWCSGLLRPDVVWFGENLPEDVWSASASAAALCDLFLSVGTSAAVYPAAGLPLLARERGAWVVEVNPRPSEISSQVDEVLTGTSAEILPKLVALLGS
jgi:NAD-dependent deacetylase